MDVDMGRKGYEWWQLGLRGSCLVIILLGISGVTDKVRAQGFSPGIGSGGPLASVEAVVGPFLPENGWTASFRSEVGSGFSLGKLQGAKLVGTITGERDLRTSSYLNKNPVRLDVYTHLRLWRLGFRGGYTNFENRSNRSNFASVDFSGFRIGTDFDIVQHRWLVWGCAIDGYLFEPEFHGAFDDSGRTVAVDVRGRRPVTVGTYVRYIPPDILGFPLHIESYWRVPFQGSRLTTWGTALVFRPQLYQFDFSCKLSYQTTYLKFQNDPKYQFNLFPIEDWELDMEWRMFGVDLAIYF